MALTSSCAASADEVSDGPSADAFPPPPDEDDGSEAGISSFHPRRELLGPRRLTKRESVHKNQIVGN